MPASQDSGPNGANTRSGTRVSRGSGSASVPSRLRTYIYLHKSGVGVRKISLGPATSRGIEEVRRECLTTAAALADERETVREDVPYFRDFVAGPWRSACFDHWKPSTQQVTNRVLRRQLLPAFGSVRLDRITHLMVVRWFDAYSKTAPGGANRVLDVLRQILNHAIVCGHIETNSARNLRRNSRAKLTRFLSREEIRRLHRVLDSYVEGSESARQQVDIIRLLLLTGCRKNEIVRLRRNEVDGDRLNLTDTKTGPRRAFLNARAQEIIERRMERGEGPWVFPSGRCPSRPQGDGLYFWYLVRRKAGLEDVRLHDLRHTVATHAVMQGISLPIVARLLGHRCPDMTLRYTHVGDAEVEATAERIGQTIVLLMAGESLLGEG